LRTESRKKIVDLNVYITERLNYWRSGTSQSSQIWLHVAERSLTWF